MRRAFLAAFLVLVLSGTVAAQVIKDLPGDLDALVDTERAFAKASVEKGMMDAFRAFIADDAILFRPGPVSGKQWLGTRPNPPITLDWRPIHADIARSGDLGWTTGPFEITRPGSAEKTHGHYMTIWRKQPDGKFRFVIDIGIGTPTAAPAGGEPGPLKAEKKGGAPAADAKAAEASLLETDRTLAKNGAAQGIATAFSPVLADDVRLMRNGQQPAAGKTEVQKALAADKGLFTWEPTAAHVSAAGDLGYVYGTYERREGEGIENGNYVRIWDRAPGGPWKLSLDIINPLPPPPPPPPAAPAPPTPPPPAEKPPQA